MARKTAEELALENRKFWQEVEREDRAGLRDISAFDLVMSRRYADKNLPYLVHRTGHIINFSTGQEVLREAGPKL